MNNIFVHLPTYKYCHLLFWCFKIKLSYQMINDVSHDINEYVLPKKLRFCPQKQKYQKVT